MAIPFLNNLNLNDNQLQNAKLHVTNSAPTAAKGQIYLDSTTSFNRAKYHNGTSWLTVLDTSMVDNTSIEIDSYQLSLKATTVTAGSYGSTTAIPTFTVDADGRLTAAGTASISTSWTITDGTTSQPIANGNTLTVNGTANEVSVAVTATDTLTIGLPDNVTIGGILTVTTSLDMTSGKIENLADPTSAQDAATKAYVDSVIVGALNYQGGYNASTNSPALDASPVAGIKKGWTYTVTADGLFFTEQVRIGDVIIAEKDSPTLLADWTIVQANTDLATASTVGIGNVAAGTAIGVTYSAGTATITNNGVTSVAAGTGVSVSAATGAVTISADYADSQYKVSIGDGSALSYTVTHNLGTKDVIVQLYDVSSFETVYADVVRTTVNTLTISFASAPASNDIRVLVQALV